VTVSCGHSDATAAEAREAFARGVKTVTHIFNAMRPFAAREPGWRARRSSTGDVVVQVILDGVTSPNDTARLVWQAAGGASRW
jgi:N-acetylglucosamine-6-phosphate deacetylase